MDYMDHWAYNEPAPTIEKEYRVGIRVMGGKGVIYINVNAVNWEQAHDKALGVMGRSARIESCLSKGNY